jgi:acetolactate synthase-1/2/3 large subunit
MAKLVERIDAAERIPEYVARAFATAMNGRPGPVVLVLPEDMLTQVMASEALNVALPKVMPRVAAVEAEIGSKPLFLLGEMLSKAKRPMVIVGGSGWSPQAAQDLQQFAEHWQLPVGNAFRFQDTFDNHHPLYAGDVGLGINPRLAKRIQDSDLILAIGARLGEITTGGYTLIQSPRPSQTLVHLHASAEELNRVFQADLAIQTSVTSAAAALKDLPAPAERPWASWAADSHADYLTNLQPSLIADLPQDSAQGVVNMPQIIAVLQQHLPQDAVLTNGAGNFASWLHRYFRFHGLAKGHKTQLAPTNGAMGYGVPAGIAAAITTGRTAFTIAGDGDFLMNGQELATAAQYGAKSIILLLNNGMFGTIRMHQEREYPQRVAGTPLANPDFCLLAQAYGYASVCIDRTEDFEEELLAALARPQGTLIELTLDPQAISTRGSLNSITQSALTRQLG